LGGPRAGLGALTERKISFAARYQAPISQSASPCSLFSVPTDLLHKVYFHFRKEDGTLRTMNAEKLLKTLPVLQSQLDALLEFDCTANDLTNGVINMAFMLLFRDLIRLFACYNDGIINLLGKITERLF
jgi:hypothetical protein